jgi:hypothetical protein
MGLLMLQRVKRCFLLAASCSGLGCDLSDLTDGRAGGGGAGASGGSGAGASGPGPGGAATGGSGGSGAEGGIGGEGGAPCEVVSPFTWLAELGNANQQAVNGDDLLGAPPSSIRVASVTDALGGGFVLAIVTEGPSPFDGEGDGRALFLARFGSDGSLLAVRPHPQPPSSGQPFLISDVLVDDAGTVYVSGLVGRADVELQTDTTPILLPNTAPNEDLAGDTGVAAVVATFALDGRALSGARLESKTNNGSLTAPAIFRRGAEVGLAGVSRNGFTGLTCATLSATGNLTFGYVLMLTDSTLASCSRASRFEATLGTALDLTAATTDGDSIYVVGRYSAANAGNAITFRSTPAPAWLVELESNQGLLLSYDGATLAPRWVTTLAGVGIDDRVLGVGFDPASTTLWAAGTGSRGSVSAATSSISRRFSASSGMVGACDLEHPGSGTRAGLVALDTDGGCVATAGYSLGSEARAVVDGTPWVAGFAARDSRPSLTTFATAGPAPAVPYGMLFSPTATAADVTESGVLFGAQIAVRVEDLALVDGKVVVVGTMGERFLDLTCETSALPGGFDFFVGAIDPAAIP